MFHGPKAVQQFVSCYDAWLCIPPPAELDEYKKSSTHRKELAKLKQENKELNKRIDNLQRGAG